MQRLALVGPVGAGKSALADEVARRTGVERTELDALRFDDQWQQLPEAEFRAEVERITAADRWIVDGNYASVRDVLWRRADTVVWLDYSLPVVLWRLVSRTLRRVITREDLGSGRRENVRRLVGRRSILLWAIKSHGPLRREYERATEVYGSRLTVVRLRSPADARQWLATVTSGPDAGG